MRLVLVVVWVALVLVMEVLVLVIFVVALVLIHVAAVEVPGVVCALQRVCWLFVFLVNLLECEVALWEVTTL